MPPGQIILTDRSFNGTLKAIYTSATGEPIATDQGFTPIPVLTPLTQDDSETQSSPLALQRALTTFEQLYRLTGDQGSDGYWRFYAEVARQTLANLDLGKTQRYLLKRSAQRGVVLSHAGTTIRTLSTRPLVTLRPEDGMVWIYHTGGQESGIWQEQAHLTLDGQTGFEVEFGLSQPGILFLAIETSQNRWEAPIAASSTGIDRAIVTVEDFVQWTAQTEWQPEMAFAVQHGDTGSANATPLQLQVEQQSSVVIQFTLASNFDYAIGEIVAVFQTIPTSIMYGLTGSFVTLRVQDGSGWFWERTLPITDGRLTKLPLAWNQFSLSATQINPGQPISPDVLQPIQKYQFVGRPETSILQVYYVGEPPIRLQAPVQIERCGVFSRLFQPHILKVGDLQPSPAPQLTYTPGVMSQAIQTKDEATELISYPLSYQQAVLGWDLLNLHSQAEQIYQFWQAAQAAYSARTGTDGGFAPSYNWDVSQFYWDQDGTKGIWQAEIGALAAQGWFRQPKRESAEAVVIAWLGLLDRLWKNGNAVALTDFPENAPPQSNGIDIAIVALYAQAALFANLAGGDRVISYRVLKKSVDYLLSHANFAPSREPVAREGYTIAIVMETVTHILTHQNSIQFPLPSDTGDFESDFAAKLVRFRHFDPTLSLAEGVVNGFRFRVPVLPQSDQSQGD
jgi:hypothetical protein